LNYLTRGERKAKCRAAQESLAHRIAEYRPLAIVALLLSIREIVGAARYAVPFPGMGLQSRFREAMACIIPLLPKIG
jgi:hypothetical protein